jgi:hypothetical protein
MNREACLTVLMVVGLVPLGQVHGGPFGLFGKKPNDAPVGYSPWHYRTPELVRLRNQHHLPPTPMHAADRFPHLPVSGVSVAYPHGVVPRHDPYLHTGLSYDPARPIGAPTYFPPVP